MIKEKEPRKDKTFVEGEIRNAFLAQAMSSTGRFEDQERETLTRYLEEKALNCMSGAKQIRGLNLMETREVYKYKRREIKGDPLEEMPKLSPNPPAFEPIGRYTFLKREN